MACEHCELCRFPIPAIPRSWSGSLTGFVDQFIKARLPPARRVEAWSRWIVDGIATTDVVVARGHGPFKRAVITHVDELEVRPSDISPVWAVQQAILHSEPPAGVTFGQWARSLPLKHNVARQCRMDLLNRAGFHMAHMFDVAVHRGPGLRGSAADIRNACLLELHPINAFWIPIARWRYWGAQPAVALPTMQIGIGPTSIVPNPLHFVYGVAGTVQHALELEGGKMALVGGITATRAYLSSPLKISFPILFPNAVLRAEEASIANCFTACVSAIFRGWGF